MTRGSNSLLVFFIFSVSTLLAVCLLVACFLAEAQALGGRFGRLILAAGLFFGAVGGTAIYIYRLLKPKQSIKPVTALNRQLLAAAWAALSVALLIWLAACLIRRIRKCPARAARLLMLGFGALSLGALTASVLPALLQKTGEFVAFGEDSFGTASLFRTAGFLLGIALCLLAALSFYKLLIRMTGWGQTVFPFLFLTVAEFDLGLKGISALARLQILHSSHDFVFKVMIFEDQSLPVLAALYLGVVMLSALFVFLTHLRLSGSFRTPAHRRKALWWLRNCRRWSLSAAVFMVMAFVTISVLQGYVNRPVELAPAQAYEDHGDQIIVPLSDVDDGHLHRFSYRVDGHDIRFIVVKKPKGSAYGVGLDACDICGVAGYYERNNDIICKRCDVVMNKATIGFKGGCNPVPFPYEIADMKIIIRKADLEAEKNRFPAGE